MRDSPPASRLASIPKRRCVPVKRRRTSKPRKPNLSPGACPLRLDHLARLAQTRRVLGPEGSFVREAQPARQRITLRRFGAEGAHRSIRIPPQRNLDLLEETVIL